MAHVNEVEKSLGEQVADLLDRMPQNYDVTFCVGPDRVEVKAVKILLKAVSPVFQKEFDDKWENGVIKEGGGIPLPDVDPTIFQTFVKLVTSDTWSLDALNALNMSANTKLSLLGLCRRYEIPKAIKNLEEVVNKFIESFGNYKDTPELLELSQDNLETVFACDELRLKEKEIFECACRWSGNQCTLQGFEATGENYRKVLGNCLFEIRFPTMSNEEFTDVCLLENDVLKEHEKLAVFLFIGLHIDAKINYDRTRLQFKTIPRGVNMDSLFGCSVLSLPEQFKLTTSPLFVCDGKEFRKDFQVMQKISLHGIGFLGPIDGDTQFDVTVQVKKCIGVGSSYKYMYDSGKLRKNIFASKGKMFYFLLDEPITAESSSTFDSSWKNSYDIFFCLKGTSNSNIPQYKVDNPEDESVQASGVQFHLGSDWNCKNPLAQLLFKKI